MSKKKNRENNESINMDDLLDALRAANNRTYNEADDDDSDDDDLDDRIRKILRQEFKAAGINHRAAANETRRDNIDTDEEPKTPEEKLELIIKLLKNLLGKNNQNQTHFSRGKMPWDDLEFNDSSKVYCRDEFGNPIDCEVLDADDEKTFPNDMLSSNNARRFVNSIFGY